MVLGLSESFGTPYMYMYVGNFSRVNNFENLAVSGQFAKVLTAKILIEASLSVGMSTFSTMATA